jgi:hypothetical protein
MTQKFRANQKTHETRIKFLKKKKKKVNANPEFRGCKSPEKNMHENEKLI